MSAPPSSPATVPSRGGAHRPSLLARNPYVWVVVGALFATLAIVTVRELWLRPAPLPLVGARVADGAELAPSEGTPPVLFSLPELQLQDEQGRPFSRASLRGRTHVFNFFFTSCPSICPKLMKHMAALQTRTASHGDALRLVSITVDPKTDTPERLRDNGAKYGADPKRWTFLTGPIPAIERAVQDGFKQAMERQGTTVKNATGDDVYDITHSAKLVLVDGDGRIRGFYDADEPGTVALLRDAGRVTAERAAPAAGTR